MAMTTSSMYNGCFFSEKRGESFLSTDKISKKYKPSDPNARFFYPQATKERKRASKKTPYYCIKDEAESKVGEPASNMDTDARYSSNYYGTSNRWGSDVDA